MPETTLTSEGTSTTDASQQSANNSTDATSQQSNQSADQQSASTSDSNASTEGKTEGDNKPGDQTEGDGAKKDAEGDKKTEGAPEKYEPFTMPEGIKLEGEKLAKFEGIAKELGLTQAQAQKLASLGGELIGDVSKQQEVHLSTISKEWETQSRSDKEYGGAQLDGNLATAKKALDAFASPTFRELLDKTGLGNHPEVVRTFFRVGNAISEDKVITSNQENVSRDPADILFGQPTS